MARNPPPGDNQRVGAVRERSQTYNPHNHAWVKRDTDTGRFIDQKADTKPFNRLLKNSHKHPNPSFRRKPESSLLMISLLLIIWTPAFAGVTKPFSAPC